MEGRFSAYFAGEDFLCHMFTVRPIKKSIRCCNVLLSIGKTRRFKEGGACSF
jgi:hypothetical protein